MSRGPKLVLNGVLIENCGTGIKATGDVKITAGEGLRIINTGTAFDIKEGISAPAELVDKTMDLLSQQHRASNGAATVAMADAAAEKSGLKAWLKDKSVEIASLGAALLALYLGIG